MRYAKLRGRIREKFGTQEAFSVAMGINPTTISTKLNGKTDWTRAEIEKAGKLLDIPAVEVHVYFFDL